MKIIDFEKAIFELEDDTLIFIKSTDVVSLLKEEIPVKEQFEMLFSDKYGGKILVIDKINKKYGASNCFCEIETKESLFELLL